MMLEDVLKESEIQAYKHQQLMYSSSLPLYQNCEEFPEPPQPPYWLEDLISED